MSTKKRVFHTVSRAFPLVSILALVACRTERTAPSPQTRVSFRPVEAHRSPVRYPSSVAFGAEDAGASTSDPFCERTVQGQNDDELYRARLDLSEQVLAFDVDVDPGPVEGLDSNFRNADPGFVSAAVLSWKARQFDEGLSAAVEAAADQGVGSFPSRKKLLEAIHRAVTTIGGSKPARAFMDATLKLGGLAARVHEEGEHEDGARAAVNGAPDPATFRPLGFYAWSDSLAQTYRRNRWLHSALRESVALELATIIAKDDAIGAAYAASVDLLEGLSNPFRTSDLRPLVRAIRAGEQPNGVGETAFWPESRSHESQAAVDWIEAQAIGKDGGQLLPSGMDDLIRRVEAGTVSLRLRPDSGWYDRQLFAVEPLIVPNGMPESSRLVTSPRYRDALRSIVLPSHRLTRERHIVRFGREKSNALRFYPHLSIEPLPSYYERRADSYRFVRGLLEKAFGIEGLDRMRRMTLAGPVDVPLSQELQLMESLFRGASLVAREELGMLPDACPSEPQTPMALASHSGAPPFGPGNRAAPVHCGNGTGSAIGNQGGTSAADIGTFRRWAKVLARDPDLSRDVRMMVPVSYDERRQQYRVWLVLGIRRRDLSVCFRASPSIKGMVDAYGTPIDLRRVATRFDCEAHGIEEVVTAEANTSRLITREEFARLCDRVRSVNAILANLP